MTDFMVGGGGNDVALRRIVGQSIFVGFISILGPLIFDHNIDFALLILRN